MGHRAGAINIGSQQDKVVDLIALTFNSIFPPKSTEECKIDGFLLAFDGGGKNRSNMLLEIAIAHGINGNIDVARNRLEQILLLKTRSPILSKVQAVASQVLIAIDLQNGSFEDLVQKWELQNISAHFPGLVLGNR